MHSFDFTFDFTSAQLSYRPTEAADLAFVLATEQHPDNAPFIGQWSQKRHEAAIASPDEAHFIVEALEATELPQPSARPPHPVGYLIFLGLTSPHGTVNLKRIVCTHKGRGYGRQMLQWSQAYAFETLGCHRLWLDVLVSNHRARALYESAGFIAEGILRECWKRPSASGSASASTSARASGSECTYESTYESMVLMSRLRPEWLHEPRE